MPNEGVSGKTDVLKQQILLPATPNGFYSTSPGMVSIPRHSGGVIVLTKVSSVLARGTVAVAAILTPYAGHAVLATTNGIPPWPMQAASALQMAGLTWVAAGIAGGLVRQAGGLLAVLAAVAFLAVAAIAARTSLVIAAALSHGALYLGVCLLFGLSLRSGREALVSRLARRVESCPTPALMAYTRGVTWLWAGFGAAQLVASALLLATAPLPVWSAFVNVLDAPLVGLVFAAEYAVRRWRFRHTRLASLAETVRAFARRDVTPACATSQ
jgi:uncharacterized membrane protein